MKMPELMRAKQVIEKLRLPVTWQTLLVWAKAGRIPCTRINGRMILFDLAAVVKALSNDVTPATPAVGENNVESGRDFQI